MDNKNEPGWGDGAEAGGREEGALLLWDQKGRCGQNMGRHGESELRRQGRRKQHCLTWKKMPRDSRE